MEKMAAENPFMKIFFKSFGFQNQKKEKEADMILEFTEKSTAAQKEFIMQGIGICHVEEHFQRHHVS